MRNRGSLMNVTSAPWCTVANFERTEVVVNVRVVATRLDNSITSLI